jgi:hypothetical protein
LGDEALRVLSTKTSSPEELALWYGKWAANMASRKVDFGLALRNKPSPEFHARWARQAPPDRLKWEVLNRLHRVLNEAERRKP